MADLDPDLLEQDILPKLPFKSVVRWMCTSRSWYGRIRSAEFSQKYLRKSMDGDTNRCLLLSTPDPTPTQFFRLAIDDNDAITGQERPIDQPLTHTIKRTHVVGHSNGLVCICSHDYRWIFTEFVVRGLNEGAFDGCELAIWNPSISRFKRVPMLPWFSDPTDDTDALKYPPSYGFAFNPGIEDFEIVQINQCWNARTQSFTSEVWIYTLGTNVWRRIANLDARYNVFKIGRELEGNVFNHPLVNGHMHWLMEDQVGGSLKVIAFDVENEEFFDCGSPRDIALFARTHLCSLGDKLCLLNYRDQEIHVWQMNEHKNAESWVGNFRMTCRISESFVSCLPLVHSKADRGTLFLAIVMDGYAVNEYILYLFWSKLTSEPADIVQCLGSIRNTRATSFVESFLLADGEPIPRTNLPILEF